jgi:CHASE2 domain-containing sensor protein
MGYGDMFVAALLGAVLAREGRRQGLAALLTLVLAGLFDLLFLVLHELPATVPVALALVAIEAWYWWRARRVRRVPEAGRVERAATEAGPGPAASPQTG